MATQSSCVMNMGGGLVALKQLEAAKKLCGLLAQKGLVQSCPDKGLPPGAQQALNRKVLCEVFCCCNNEPNITDAGTKARQQCASETLMSVDQFSGWKSRYKAEVSYRDGQPIMFPPNGTRPWYPTPQISTMARRFPPS